MLMSYGDSRTDSKDRGYPGNDVVDYKMSISSILPRERWSVLSGAVS